MSGLRSNLGQGRERADLDAARGRTNAAELIEAGEVDDRLRLLDPLLEPDEAVVAPREFPHIRPPLVQEGKRIREIARLIELEAGHDVFDGHVRLAQTQLTCSGVCAGGRFASALMIMSVVTGKRLKLTPPSASWIALTIAPHAAPMGGSPMPFAPSG